MKILIADDSRVMRNTMMNYLKLLEFSNFVEAFNGSDAFQKFQEDSYHFVLLDTNLSQLTALELVAKIRSDDPNTPILMTSESNNHAYAEGMRLGVNDFLIKPFGVQVLQSKLSTLKLLG